MDADADELHITNSIFSNIGSNITSGLGGTAIWGLGNTVTISKSKFSNNESRGSGGALSFSENATVNISSSEFSNNAAGRSGGAISSSGTGASLSVSTSLFTGNSASIEGGAIWSSSTLNVYRSVFSRNQSGQWGGAISFSSAGTNVLENSTFYDNKSTDEEGGAVAGGGAGTTTIIRHVTFVNNEATETGADSNGNSVFAFASAAFQMYNSISKTNTSHDGDDCVGLDTNTNNIIQDGSCSTSSTYSVDPQLGERRGTYFPISPGGPAYDAADATACTALADVNGFDVDQRGRRRPYPVGGACDIGAYEWYPPPPPPPLPEPDDTEPNCRSLPARQARYGQIGSADWRGHFARLGIRAQSAAAQAKWSVGEE